MSTLFETTTIKDLQLDNRFVASATWMGMAGQDGACTPQLIDVMTHLAQGGVGLMFAGFAFVHAQGRLPWMMGCHEDQMLPGLSEMTRAVHQAGGKIGLQITHAGLQSPAEMVGGTPLGPSPLLTEQGPLGRAMTQDEIQETVQAFGAAAGRAVDAGFDSVQIHAPHGYLLSEFLSPFFNKRTDDYGGSLENRARLLRQVVEAVQDATDHAVPVFVKLNSDDLLPGGFSRGDMLGVSAMLQDAGIDAIELSGGTIGALFMNQPDNSPCQTGEARLYWRSAAEEYKSHIGTPLMLVGGIRSIEAAEEIVDSGLADYVALCRPLIREPALINRWKAGDRAEAACLSCNSCLWAGIQGQGVHCVQAVH